MQTKRVSWQRPFLPRIISAATSKRIRQRSLQLALAKLVSFSSVTTDILRCCAETDVLALERLCQAEQIGTTTRT